MTKNVSEKLHNKHTMNVRHGNLPCRREDFDSNLVVTTTSAAAAAVIRFAKSSDGKMFTKSSESKNYETLMSKNNKEPTSGTPEITRRKNGEMQEKYIIYDKLESKPVNRETGKFTVCAPNQVDTTRQVSPTRSTRITKRKYQRCMKD